MLNLRTRQAGMSIIEIMVVIGIIAILLAAAAPNFTVWLQSSQIRTSSDSVLAGMQLARAEAVRRNVPIRFQFVTTLGADCAIDVAGTNWVISVNDPTNQCNTEPSDTQPDPPPVPLDPLIKQRRSSADGSANVTVTSTVSAVTFTPLGQASSAATVDFANPVGGACSPGGPMRCMRVVLSPGGQARMCDPARVSTAAAPDPQAC